MKNVLHLAERQTAAALSRAGQIVARHPGRLTAIVVAGLAGFAATAFGIAPMTEQAAPSRTQSVISEAVQPVDLQAQAELLAENELSLYRSDLTRRSDTADSLLRRLNAPRRAGTA